jgi:hypothetical protein
MLSRLKHTNFLSEINNFQPLPAFNPVPIAFQLKLDVSQYAILTVLMTPLINIKAPVTKTLVPFILISYTSLPVNTPVPNGKKEDVVKS